MKNVQKYSKIVVIGAEYIQIDVDKFSKAVSCAQIWHPIVHDGLIIGSTYESTLQI